MVSCMHNLLYSCGGILLNFFRRPHQPSRYIHRAPSPTVDSHHDAFEMYRDDPLLDTTETTPWYFDREYVKDNISLVSINNYCEFNDVVIIYDLLYLD